MSAATMSGLTPSNRKSTRKALGQHGYARVTRTIVYVLLAGYGLISIYPFLWMVSASLKTDLDMLTDSSLLPANPTTATLATTWGQLNFFQFFGNSLTVTLSTVAGVLVVYSLASYALGVLRFPGSVTIYRAFMLLLFVPGIVVLLPIVLLENNLGILGTHFGLILPLVNGTAPLAILLLTNAFRSVPPELREASLVDGASEFRVFWSIYLPSVRPALATIALLTAIPTWNEYILTSVSLNDAALYTLPLGLNQLASSTVLQYNQLMAGALIVVIPVIIAFLSLQRYFVNGLSGAVKG